jgi:ABC-2 type transport system permease protein
MNSFKQLFLANLKIVYRNTSGIFWTIIMPTFIYIALSVLPISKESDAGIKYSDFVLPGIIAMTIMQGGIYGLAYWMVDLKARGVIKRFLVTPLKEWQLALSVVASRTVVTFAQVIVLTLIGIIIFHARFVGNFISILILTTLGAAIFLLLGLLISNFAKSYETAAPITSAIGLTLTFLGNIFYPIEQLPHTLKIVAEILPITYLADGLRQAYLYPFNFSIIGKDVLILAIWLVIILAATLSVFRLKE